MKNVVSLWILLGTFCLVYTQWDSSPISDGNGAHDTWGVSQYPRYRRAPDVLENVYGTADGGKLYNTGKKREELSERQPVNVGFGDDGYRKKRDHGSPVHVIKREQSSLKQPVNVGFYDNGYKK